MEEVKYGEVLGFPDYKVGTDGTVWSKAKNTKKTPEVDGWHLLTGSPDKDGYRRVILSNKGRKRYARVNVLVLEVFIGPAPSKSHLCAHNNGVRTDNRLDNLRYDTQVNNLKDRLLHGTAQVCENGSNAILTNAQVKEIKSRLANGERVVHLSKEFGVSQPTISSIKVGRNWANLAV